MALKDIKLRPGFYSDITDRGVGELGYWKNGDKVRFRHGLPEALGGWARVGVAGMVGTARGVVDWVTTRDERVVAFGTNKKLYVWIGGTFSDITPIRASSTINNDPFSMTDTLATVTVTDTAHGATDGAYVTFSGAAAAGGITMSGEYVITYIDADSYTITHSAVATSTTTGGGASVVAAYQINTGNADSAYDLGWGTDTWGALTWGTARTSSNLITTARTWALSTWGEDLIASPHDGSIYVWDSSGGVAARATIMSGAPTDNKYVVVSQEARHIIALGAGSDPLLIKWSSSEDYTDWTATTTNTAGDYRVDVGSSLVCSVRVRGQDLVFTDGGEYTMKYIGPPYVFAVSPAGTRGIVGPNAAAVHTGIAYWMGDKNFYNFDGEVQLLPCPVATHVFDDINTTQKVKTWAGVSAEFEEIWWLYCSATSDEVDRYVAYSVLEKHWIYGTLSRTLIVGDSDVFSESYAVDPSGYMYYHESGVTDNGTALTAYLESGDVELSLSDDTAGNQMMHLSKIIPDFRTLTGTVTLKLTTKRYPQDTETQASSALTVTSTTTFLNPRVRGRQVSLRIDSTSAAWKLGTPRVDIKPHGQR